MEENLENKTDELTVLEGIIGGVVGLIGGAVIYGGFTYYLFNGHVENPMVPAYIIGGIAGIVNGLYVATGAELDGE